jgi:hypothetical protein
MDDNNKIRKIIKTTLNEFFNDKKMTVYRIGEIPYNEDRFFVAPDWKLWVKFYPNVPIFKIEATKLYLPLTDKSFNSWDELRNKAKNGTFTDEDLSYIYPEESGIGNFEQYEIKPNDIINVYKIE